MNSAKQIIAILLEDEDDEILDADWLIPSNAESFHWGLLYRSVPASGIGWSSFVTDFIDSTGKMHRMRFTVEKNPVDPGFRVQCSEDGYGRGPHGHRPIDAPDLRSAEEIAEQIANETFAYLRRL